MAAISRAVEAINTRTEDYREDATSEASGVFLMPDGMSIIVEYWAIQEGDLKLFDLVGIEEFRQELGDSYTAVVRGRPGPAGGNYRLAVEILSAFTLQHLISLLLDGIAYDWIKEGAKSFILRPFLSAFRKLRERNQSRGHGDIDSLRLVFQDCIVIIDSTGDDSIASCLEQILHNLAADYSHLILQSGERPYEIYIPIFEDPAPDRPSRFRVCVHWDETIESISPSDYFVYWGLWYDFARKAQVFDVSRKLLIDEGFMTQQQYWSALRERELRG